MSRTYLILEIKRALRRLPLVLAGALLLFILIGAGAFLASRMLYGEGAVGRIRVGVSVPEDDALGRQVVEMLGSIDSVKSVCDFEYMDLEKCLDELGNGGLFAALEVPRDFVRDIITGKNTPVIVWLPAGAGLEGRLFAALADAGSRTLGASQAGIYAGNEMYAAEGALDEIPALEADLNRYYLDFSLDRLNYFRHLEVDGTGEVDTARFYMISAFVLFLFLAPVPAGEYLLSHPPVMKNRLSCAGIGAGLRVSARILGLFLVLAAVSVLPVAAVCAAGLIKASAPLWAGWLMACLAASALVIFFYSFSQNLLGGLLLLVFFTAAQHFLAGGFLPQVFLPSSVRAISGFMPSSVLMEIMKSAVLGQWNLPAAARAVGMILAVSGVGVLLERRRS